MGAFIANFHVRSQAGDTVHDACAAIGATQFRASDARSGWVSIYEQRASGQDEAWIEQFSRELSARLKGPCVAFLVHDSDIARYWLNDQGQLLDEYNSIPDYFDQASDEEKRRLKGRAEVFLRYCQPGVTAQEVEAVLRTETTFAEDTIMKLAEFLGIEPERVLGDFGHPESGGGGSLGDFAEDDGDNDGGSVASMSGQGGSANLTQRLQAQFARMLGATDTNTSPAGDALVQAAAAGNVAEIDRLVQAGADVNAPGILPLETFGPSAAAAALMPKIALSPLLAAASRGQAKAAKRLLELKANAMETNPMFGSALHAAAQRGSAATIEVLLMAGLPANLKNQHGHTPLDVVQAARTQVEMAKNLAKSMPQMQAVYDQLLSRLESMNMTEAAWHACEEVLRAAGG